MPMPSGGGVPGATRAGAGAKTGRSSGSRSRRTYRLDLPSPLEEVNANGIVLTDVRLGNTYAAAKSSFLSPESSRIRLLVACNHDAEGRLGIRISDSQQQIEALPAGLSAAAQGLLRVGDRVLSYDGIALRTTTLAKVHASSSRHDHVMIVDRQDAGTTKALMNLSAEARDDCVVAQLLSAKLVVPKPSRRLRGSTCSRLGLELNRYNKIEAIEPLSVAAIDDTLRKDDVIVELNGITLGQLRLVDELKNLPKPLGYIVLTVVRLPQKCKDALVEARTVSSERASTRMDTLMGGMLSVTIAPTGHTWTTYQEALKLSGGNQVAARLIMQKDREGFVALDRMAVMIQSRWRGKKVRAQIIEARNRIVMIQRVAKMKIAIMRKKQKRKEALAALVLQAQFRIMQAPKRKRESLLAKADTHKLTALTRMSTFKEHRKDVEQAHRTGEGVLTQTTTLKGKLSDLSPSDKDSMRTSATYSFAAAIGVDASLVEVKLEDGSIKLVTTVQVEQGQTETIEAAMKGLASNPSRIANMLKVPEADIMSVSAPKKKALVEMRWGRARLLSTQKLVVNVSPQAFGPPPVFQRPTSNMTASDIAQAMLKQVGMKRLFMEYANIDSEVSHTGLIELVMRQLRGLCISSREAVRSESIKQTAVNFVHTVQAGKTEAMDWPTFQGVLVDLASGDIRQQNLLGAWEMVLDEDIQQLRKAQHRRRRVQLETHTQNRGVVYPKYNFADPDDDDDDERPSPSSSDKAMKSGKSGPAMNAINLGALLKSDQERVARDRGDSTDSTLSSKIRLQEKAAKEGDAVELAITMTSHTQAAKVSTKAKVVHMGHKDRRNEKMSYFGAMGPALVAKHILAHEQCRPRAYATNPVECKEEHRKKSALYTSLQKRIKKKSGFLDADLGLDEVSSSLTRLAPRSPKREPKLKVFKFVVGARVKNKKDGVGTVTEHMENGNTKVTFDSGEEREFKPRAMRKFKEVVEESAESGTYETFDLDRESGRYKTEVLPRTS